MKKLLIIPAAGLATRMMPMSASMSKAMIPVAGKPILAHILSSVMDYVDKIVVVHGKHDDIKNYLDKKNYPKVHYVEQYDNAIGPLAAIYTGLDYFSSKLRNGNENYYTTIWLGDTLIKNKETVKDILTEYNEEDTTQLCVSQVDDWSRWCLIAEDASELFDKPIEQPGTDNALVGIYKFNYDFDDLLSVIEFLILNFGHEEIAPLIESYDDTQRNLIDVTQCWVDCGDLPSLYKANSILITDNARSFNNISISNGVVNKQSNRGRQEIAWYSTVNEFYKNILQLTPQFYGQCFDGSYSIELCAGQTLQDLVLYHNITRRDVWETILHTVIDRVNVMHFGVKKLHFPEDTNSNTDMFLTNIVSRYTSMLNDEWLDPIEYKILIDYVFENHKLFGGTHLTNSKVIHGDLHFGNIIFDATTNKVKLIDPRGEWGIDKEPTTNGHMLYDIAKLYQSVICKYCHISTDDYPSDKENKIYDMLEDIIDKHLANYYTIEDIKIAKRYAVSLIASAIPCHSDNPKRQAIMKNMAIDLITSGKY